MTTAEAKGEARGREEGIEIGEAKGRERGREEEKLNIVKEMLNNDIDIILISQITKLTLEQIKELQKN